MEYHLCGINSVKRSILERKIANIGVSKLVRSGYVAKQCSRHVKAGVGEINAGVSRTFVKKPFCRIGAAAAFEKVDICA